MDSQIQNKSEGKELMDADFLSFLNGDNREKAVTGSSLVTNSESELDSKMNNLSFQNFSANHDSLQLGTSGDLNRPLSSWNSNSRSNLNSDDLFGGALEPVSL